MPISGSGTRRPRPSGSAPTSPTVNRRRSEVAHLVVLGEALVDLFAEPGRPAGPGAFVAKAGGAPANAATAGAKLGLDVAFIGKVGEDDLGRALRAELQACGVDTTCLYEDRRLPTMLAIVATV